MNRLDKIIQQAMAQINNPPPPKQLPSDDAVAERIEQMQRECGFMPTPEAVEPIRHYMAGYGLLLHGPTGSGKTFLMKALHHRITSVREIIDYGPEVDVWFESWDGFTCCIDDLGTEPVATNYGWREDLMRYVIAHRIDKQSGTTHITTNLDAAAIAERYGDRTLSRIMGSMKAFELSKRHWRGAA